MVSSFEFVAHFEFIFVTGVRSVWPLSPGHSLVCEEKLKNEAVSPSWTNSRLNRFGYCLLWKWGIP